MTSDPVVALELINQNAVDRMRTICGPEDPKIAKEDSPSSIRACFGTSSIQNGVHFSTADDETKLEIVSEFVNGGLIAMEIVGPSKENTPSDFRTFAGPMDPDLAKKLRPNTLRARFGLDKVRNAIHATDLPDDAPLENHFLIQRCVDNRQYFHIMIAIRWCMANLKLSHTMAYRIAEFRQFFAMRCALSIVCASVEGFWMLQPAPKRRGTPRKERKFLKVEFQS
ncbi:unnamed protein product [Nesidiocoris tenuis]|uniref:Nucleoside diphosphate kinase-like domain-containing protein n=1 Tax=Nesidiocoris tenuis TaxID=355587 RepID=A0A6H5GG22_9HEMI|nr:unnamed protein product [Nesidiocoris tenuis]CAB0000983.1 unnamed protein product [Nesidiocoris tenuis]